MAGCDAQLLVQPVQDFADSLQNESSRLLQSYYLVPCKSLGINATRDTICRFHLSLALGPPLAPRMRSASSLLKVLDWISRRSYSAIYDWFEAAHPGDRTGPNPTRTAASVPVAPCCDVTASNSTQKEPGQPARFSFGGCRRRYRSRLSREVRVPGRRSTLLPRSRALPANSRDCIQPSDSST